MNPSTMHLTHYLQEKSLVTGLEAANSVVDYLEDGKFAKILPVEEDEPQIQALRSLKQEPQRDKSSTSMVQLFS